MRVEAGTGLLRRAAPAECFKNLDRHLRTFEWLTIGSQDHAAVCELNTRHRLRAADAGHLYCLKRAARVLPEIQLVGFDPELNSATQAEGLRLWIS